MKISIQRKDIEKGRRILAVSDIHGEAALLQKLLDHVHFSHKDLLFIVGDLIEKGHKSLEALRYIMGLAKQENVVVLMGNVDLLYGFRCWKICRKKAVRNSTNIFFS